MFSVGEWERGVTSSVCVYIYIFIVLADLFFAAKARRSPMPGDSSRVREAIWKTKPEVDGPFCRTW